MQNLFQPTAFTEIKNRINQLSKTSTPLWGKMNVAQMMAHCSEAIRNAIGETTPPRSFVGRLISPFWKHKYYDEHPFQIRNLRTHPTLKITDDRDFEKEKANLLYWLATFHKEGAERSKTAIHPILGKFTPEQWAIGQYKHTDYHLRQFGV